MSKITRKLYFSGHLPREENIHRDQIHTTHFLRTFFDITLLSGVRKGLCIKSLFTSMILLGDRGSLMNCNPLKADALDGHGGFPAPSSLFLISSLTIKSFLHAYLLMWTLRRT